jgi:Flp pilus assembly protein TadD
MKSLIKKTLIFVLVMTLVAATCWIGRKAYKKSEERHLITQAKQYLATNDTQEASICLQRVLQINPLSVTADSMIANLLESEGYPSALTWRIQVAKLEPNNVTNRFLWAKTAIMTKNLKSAGEALDGVDPQYRSTAEYHKLAGALAWDLGQSATAESEYAEAMRLEPGDQVNILNLETIRLTSTNQAIATAARLSLEQKITDPGMRMVALQHLLAVAVARRDLSRALAYSKEIVSSPSANLGDKLNYAQLLRDTKSDGYPAWLASLETTATHSSTNAFELGKWMAKIEGPGLALRWLQSQPWETQTNMPVPLIITDCQIATKDWNGLLTFVSKQDWGEVEFYRLAIESLAQRSLGEDALSESSWRKTLHLTLHRQVQLTRLAEVTSLWGWTPEKTEILRQITDEFPNDKWAADQLMAQLYEDGKTMELQALLAKIHNANPTDVRVENNLANILLLRKSELTQANDLAKKAYDTAPNNPFYISTYAYSLLLQQKPNDALKVLDGMKPEYLKIPSIAAYYGVIQAQSGHKDRAREYIARAETAKLLPEEREIVRLAKDQL